MSKLIRSATPPKKPTHTQNKDKTLLEIILFLQEVNYKAKHPFSQTEQRKWNKYLNDEDKDPRGQCSKDSLPESRIKAESLGKELS